MATGDSQQLLPQRTKSLPRNSGHKTALRDLAWFCKPRSNTVPQHQSPSADINQPSSHHDPRWKSSQTHAISHPTHSHDISVPRVLEAAFAGRLAVSESARITQTVDLGSVLHSQAVHNRLLVHAASFGNTGRHIESIGQKLMAADADSVVPATAARVRNMSRDGTQQPRPASPVAGDQGTAYAKPAASASVCASGSAGGKSLERLLQSFPEVAADPHPLRDFVCSLDHAGIRWYGRIFVGAKCLFFTGTGISLNSAATRRSASTASHSAQTPAWNVSANSKSVTSLASIATPLCSSGRATLPRTATEAIETAAAAAAAAADSGCASTAGAKKPWRRTAIRVHLRDITRVNKELTMGFWPNAITVGTTHRQYIFTNFLRRDRAHRCLFDAWQTFRARAAEEALVRPASPAPTHRLQLQRRANRISLSAGSVVGLGVCEMPGGASSSTERCESESTVCETPITSNNAEPSAEPAEEPAEAL
ncbi:hypothetical protein J3B02_003707, partial [Coemansia erecta]